MGSSENINNALNITLIEGNKCLILSKTDLIIIYVKTGKKYSSPIRNLFLALSNLTIPVKF